MLRSSVVGKLIKVNSFFDRFETMNLLSYFHVKWQIVNQIRTFFRIGHVMQIHGNMAQILAVHVTFFCIRNCHGWAIIFPGCKRGYQCAQDA